MPFGIKDLIPQPLLLKEKGSAGALAAAVDGLGRWVKFSSELSRMFINIHMLTFFRR